MVFTLRMHENTKLLMDLYIPVYFETEQDVIYFSLFFLCGSNNAGVNAPFALTEDNIEVMFGTNHIGKSH